MTATDPYRVLGIERGATPDEIKRAFRHLALRYHPDRNPNDPSAEQRFKEVTRAYELLSDPVRRFQYDRLGFTGDRAGGRTPPWDADGADLREVFDRLMNEAFGSNPFKGRSKGEDLRYSISVRLEEVARGTSRELAYERFVTCTRCGGSGADGMADKVVCDACGGTGEARKRGLLQIGSRCRACRGEGYVAAEGCPGCGGQGRVRKRASVRVKVPSGVESGQRLKVRDMGNAGPRKSATGDLYVMVDVEEHRYFQRDGRHVYCRLPVTFTDLALGAELSVPTLHQGAVIRVPPGTQPDQVLTLKGLGLPGPRGGRPGDQRVRVVLEIPRDLDPAARETLRIAAGAADPGMTTLRKRVLDLLDEMG